MSYKKSKKTDSKILTKYIPLLVFIGFILNLFIIVKFEKSKLPQVVYYVSTNSVEKVESDIKDIHYNNVEDKDDNEIKPIEEIKEYHYYYDYFIAGSRCIKLFGRRYSEGSPMSLGRIVKIFPDRVFLDNNIIIINTKWENYSPIEKVEEPKNE